VGESPNLVPEALDEEKGAIFTMEIGGLLEMLMMN